jgi:hypothetical protein
MLPVVANGEKTREGARGRNLTPFFHHEVTTLPDDDMDWIR